MIALRTDREIDTLRRANGIVADILAELAEAVAPGVTTGELDDLAAQRIREKGGVPAFLGYRDYPRCTCISLDEEVVHGIPGKRKLKRGQIVSIDVGVRLDGYHGDAALSVPCGKIDKTRERLLKATDGALASAIRAACAGSYLEDVSRAVQTEAEDAGFSVVRVFVGHGIGTKLHEEPQVPNFATGKRGPQLRPGMVLAIEPMVNAGTCDVRVLDDGWTAVTADGKPSAHFEHSVVVRKDGAEILSVTPELAWGQVA